MLKKRFLERYQKELAQLHASPAYKEYYQRNIKNWIDNWKLDTNAFLLDDSRNPNWSLDVVSRENPSGHVGSLEGMLHRNTGIKSLFPHPSTLQQNSNGTWRIVRNWSDPRVNFKFGGKLNKIKQN